MHVRDRNLTEDQIYPKAECSEVPKCELNTRHDNREVTLTHLTQGKLCALTNRPPAQTTRTGQ